MLNSNIFQKSLEWIYQNFKKDTSKMLIFTGTAGWALSSIAQIIAVVANPKISPEKKSFLIPQEFMDAVVNIGAFFGITMFAKKTAARLCSTGKFAPKAVREYLNKNMTLYKDKIGKMGFDLDEVLKGDKKFPADSYYSYKNYVTTLGTVGASILSCNIVTPLIRNATASRVQKSYIERKNNPYANPYKNCSGQMKI